MIVDSNKALLFNQRGSVLIGNILSKEMCYFLTNVFLRMDHINKINGYRNVDNFVPGTKLTVQPNPYNETILETCWPVVEQYVGEELIPTYAYARLYCNGNVLPPHIDRPSCEVSLTIQLGKSHDYTWPIYADGVKYDLQEGDAMLYKGCENTHWRDKCQGPEGYYSGQLFLHYVKAEGQFKNFGGDRRWTGELPFIKHRSKQMINK